VARWFAPVVVLTQVAFLLGCSGLFTDELEVPDRFRDQGVAPPAAPMAPSPRPSVKAKPTPRKTPVGQNGQLQIWTAAAVVIRVDGVPLVFEPSQGFMLWDATSGTHLIEVTNMLGKKTVAETIEIPSGQRVKYEYRSKQLSRVGTMPMSAQPVYAAPEPVPVAEPPGSVQISGISPYAGAVFVNGVQVGFNNNLNGFVVGNLLPGAHKLRVEADNRVVYQGDVDVRSGENHRCMLDASTYDWQLSCHWTRPAFM
jgi:hypothetical protein